MSLKQLSPEDQVVIRCCLAFTLQCRELEGEYQTRLGVTEDEVQALLKDWPNVDDALDGSTACLAINGALNEVCNGVRIPEEEWPRWFDVPSAIVLDIFKRWRLSRGWKPTGI